MSQDWIPRVFIDTHPEMRAIVFGPPALPQRTADKIRAMLKNVNRKTLDMAGRAALKARILKVLEEEEGAQDGDKR